MEEKKLGEDEEIKGDRQRASGAVHFGEVFRGIHKANRVRDTEGSEIRKKKEIQQASGEGER